jgi:hypothetical protein
MDANPPTSKKRSAASSDPEPLDRVFFLDRSLGGVKVAAILREEGAGIEVHDRHFPGDEKDPVWLAEVGRRDWVVLTKDRRIRYRTLEREALLAAGVAAFVLVGKRLTGEEAGDVFVRALPAIRRFLATHQRPFIAKVSRSSGVTLLVGSDG